VFSVKSVQRLYLENRNASQPVRVESVERGIERVCWQTVQPESEAEAEAEAVVRQSPFVEAWDVEQTPVL
jgi:hypothetical protein